MLPDFSAFVFSTSSTSFTKISKSDAKRASSPSLKTALRSEDGFPCYERCLHPTKNEPANHTRCIYSSCLNLSLAVLMTKCFSAPEFALNSSTAACHLISISRCGAWKGLCQSITLISLLRVSPLNTNLLCFFAGPGASTGWLLGGALLFLHGMV